MTKSKRVSLIAFALIVAVLSTATNTHGQEKRILLPSLSAKISIIDTPTTKDLYGRRISKDFYVLMVRVSNGKVPEPQRALIAHDPVLIYGNSIEFLVGMEVRDGNTWRALNQQELAALGQSVSDEDAGLTSCRSSISYKPVSIETLLGTVRPVERANLLEKKMQSLEIVPYDGDIDRIFLIPRTPIRGMVRDKEVRIAEVCPSKLQFKYSTISAARSAGN